MKMSQQVRDPNAMYPLMMPDSRYQASNSVVGGVGMGNYGNSYNMSSAPPNNGPIAPGMNVKVNGGQYMNMEGQQRMMMLDQAQTNQRSMILRQSEYEQQLASRNAFINQQLLAQHQANPRLGAHSHLTMDPSLLQVPHTQMSPNMNPELIFGGAPNGNLRRPGSLSGMLPPHGMSNFPGAFPQGMRSMNQSSFNPNGILDGSSLVSDISSNEDHLRKEEKKETVVPAREMPVRPLSAYNFFFRDERERILSDGPDAKPRDDEEVDAEAREKKKMLLLEQHLLKDRSKRRPHRKTHGKIGFTNLSKLIGKRWRELSDLKKQYYRDVAAMDMDRYQRDVAEYNKGRLFQKPSK